MSDTVSIDRFVSRVSMDCPGGIDFLKKEAVRGAAVDFFKKTRAWREYVSEGAFVHHFHPEVDANRLARMVSAQAMVFDVNGVWLSKDKTPLRERSRSSMDAGAGAGDWRGHSAKVPTGYFLTPKRMIRVYPELDQGAEAVGLDVEMVLTPDLDADVFPAFMSLYAETICAGAAQRLKSQPGMPWSNPEQARFFMRLWLDGVREARLEKARRVASAINERRRTSFR